MNKGDLLRFLTDGMAGRRGESDGAAAGKVTVCEGAGRAGAQTCLFRLARADLADGGGEIVSHQTFSTREKPATVRSLRSSS